MDKKEKKKKKKEQTDQTGLKLQLKANKFTCTSKHLTVQK